MNRLAVLFAALGTLGTGCVVNDNCARTVAIGWPDLLVANGSHFDVNHCASAGVSTFEVFVDGQSVGQVPCNEGGLNVTGVDSARTFTVEGLDGSGAIVLRDEVTAGGSCHDELVDTQPSEGTFTLDYHFTPTDVCSANSVIWFAMRDNASGDLIVVDDAHSPNTYLCSDLITFPLASGSYTLQRTEEAVSAGGTWHATGANCNAANFSVNGAHESLVSVSMADTSSFCP